jgi:hypothetical protein
VIIEQRLTMAEPCRDAIDNMNMCDTASFIICHGVNGQTLSQMSLMFCTEEYEAGMLPSMEMEFDVMIDP